MGFLVETGPDQRAAGGSGAKRTFVSLHEDPGQMIVSRARTRQVTVRKTIRNTGKELISRAAPCAAPKAEKGAERSSVLCG